MSGLDLKYDGVIYQLTGELLEDEKATSDIRWMCAESYWRSLQVFTFGQIFGGRLITEGLAKGGDVVAKPMVALFDGGPRPGEELLTTHFPNKRKPKLPSVTRPTAEDLINDLSYSEELKSTLRRLGRLRRDEDARYWCQHMIREVYLGFTPNWQAGAHRFFPNTEKEDAVPDAFVADMQGHVLKFLGGELKKRDAPIEELPLYIRRNTVAHVAIHPVSNKGTDLDFENPDVSARIFHGTRESLAKDEVAEQLWMIQDLIVPGLLKAMLEEADKQPKSRRKREDLIGMIQDASSQSDKLDPIRESLADAVAAGRGGRMDDLKKIRAQLKNLSAKAGPAEERRVILSGRDRYRDAISVLAQMKAGPDDPLWEEVFINVFPELRPKQPLRKGWA